MRKKYQENVSKPPAPDGRGPYPLGIRIRITPYVKWATRAGASPALATLHAGGHIAGRPTKDRPYYKIGYGQEAYNSERHHDGEHYPLVARAFRPEVN